MTSLSITSKKVYQDAWETYQKWRKNPIFCPVLNSEVKATLKGWRHIAGVSKKRVKKDILNRLGLLQHVHVVLVQSKEIYEVRHTKKFIYYALERTISYDKTDKLSYLRIRVVVVKHSNGSIVFLSVMEKKMLRNAIKMEKPA